MDGFGKNKKERNEFPDSSVQWAFCTKNWSHGKKSALLDGKKSWHPPLGHRKQRRVKLDRLEFLCVQIFNILLPSSMVDFVPCDQLVQKGLLLAIDVCHSTF